MPAKILSDVISISKNTEDIESEIKKHCHGLLLRWAIVEVNNESLKISYSYKSEYE